MSNKSILIVLPAAMATVLLAQQTAKPVPDVAEMEPLLSKIATYEYGQSREPLAQLTLFIESSLQSPALLKQIEARLIRFLQSSATAAAKDVAFRELSLIATAASVPLLTGMLVKPETAEMARFALARIPGSVADEALRKSLEKTSGTIRIGIINSLAQRRDSKAVPLLKPLLLADPGTAEAASAALGDIGDLTALEALAGARSKVAGPLRQRVTEAYLQCAGRVAASGGKAAALKVYNELIAAKEPETIRVAALGELASAAGAAAVPVLTAELDSNSPRMQAAAIRLLSAIPGPEITASLVKQFPKLQASGQVRLLASLADRGDGAARPVFVTAATNRTGDVRVAALAGLGKLGDSSSVALLAEAAAAGQGAEQTVARESLARLRGPAVDAAIVKAIDSASGKIRAELIMAAGARGITASAGALIKAVHDKDADVHRESLRALRNVAGPVHVPALLQLLLESTTAPDRREATQTLASVLKRSESARVAAVVSAFKTGPPMESRLALLEVMGQTSSDEALPLLRASLKDPAPEIVRGAILALSEWSNTAPLPDLLALARAESNPALQVLALRGYLRLVALPSQRPATDSVKMLGEAMTLAKQPAEKRTVLSLLPSFASREALQLAEAALNDEAVAKEAKAAADQIKNLQRFR